MKDSKVLLETDLTKFSTCNENNVCDISESTESCPSDCTCGNGVCDENEDYLKCSADCKYAEKENGTFQILLYLAAGIIFMVIIFLIVKKKYLKK